MQSLPHDQLLNQLISLRRQSPHTLHSAAHYFVKGVAGTLPRGRSVLMDYLRLRQFQPHTFQGTSHCEVCGLPLTTVIRSDDALRSAYAGHASNEVIESVLPRWQDTITLPASAPTGQEDQVLRDLLLIIAESTDNETPGQLEKRIAKARILPKTDKYKRHGILQTLAECGILPNELIMPLYEGPRTQKKFWDAHQHLKGSSRSDIVLPLAGWRGHMGVSMDRYREIFSA